MASGTAREAALLCCGECCIQGLQVKKLVGPEGLVDPGGDGQYSLVTDAGESRTSLWEGL
jgi:hypothetical protein